MRVRILFGAACCVLAGCATYQGPAATEAHATLDIDGEAKHLSQATGWAVYDNLCQDRNDKSGSLVVTGNVLGRHKEAQIRAGAPVWLVARGAVSTGAKGVYNGVELTMAQCMRAIRFTPEAGKTYAVKLAADECGFTLVDQRTGLPPPDAAPFAGSAAGKACLQPVASIAPAPHVPSISDPVPNLPAKGQERFRDFLHKPLPRAFAISDNGYSVSVSGTQPEDKRYPADPVQRALQMCKEFAGRDCRLYMVDERIVYQQ